MGQTQNLKRAKGDEKWEEDKSKTTKVETSDLLRERAFGCLQGQPFSQLKAIAKAEGKRSWTQLVPEGGESDAQIQQRCDKFLKGLFNGYHRTSHWKTSCSSVTEVSSAT